MKKTGQLLKDKREAANLSLSEVALATKINPKILTAMESGDERALPAKTFLKGFLKSYALFLKMDPEEVLRSYIEESGGPAPVREHEIHKLQQQQVQETSAPAASTLSTPKAERRQADRRRMDDENSSSLRTAAVIVIVVLIGVIIGVRELIEKYQREKQVETSQVKVTPLEQPPLVPANEQKPAETAAGQPTTPGTPAAPPPPPAGATAEIPAASKPKPKPSEAPAPPATAAAPAATPPPPAPAPAPAPQTAAVPKEEKKAEPASSEKKNKNVIILEALDKVDVKFQIKGETKRLSLAPTQVHTIQTDQPLTLDLSDGGAVNIILNGRERGVPGDLGKPKTIKIP